MKKLIGLFVMTFLAQASALAEQTTLSCKSVSVVEGWSGSATRGYVNYQADVLNKTVLSHVEITGAYNATSADDLVVAQDDSSNKYPRYQFAAVEDAWHWFFLLVPKGYTQTNGSFRATLKIVKEETPSAVYVDMQCMIIYKI
jgi:hypothetical protein